MTEEYRGKLRVGHLLKWNKSIAGRERSAGSREIVSSGGVEMSAIEGNLVVDEKQRSTSQFP